MSVRRALFLCAAGAAIAASSAPSARAVTLSLPAVADTTINQRTPNNNMGGLGQLHSGADGDVLLRRSLIQFDVAGGVPAGSIIESATLYLSVNAANVNTGAYSLHRLLVSWGEGSGVTVQGQPALPGDATWNHRHHPNIPWSAAGGLAGVDYVAVRSAATIVSAPGEYAWTGLAADVQIMLDAPATNFGWMLISGRESTALTARQFESSESTTTAVPRLEISYRPIPEPSGIALAAAIGAAAVLRRTVRRRRGGRHASG